MNRYTYPVDVPEYDLLAAVFTGAHTGAFLVGVVETAAKTCRSVVLLTAAITSLRNVSTSDCTGLRCARTKSIVARDRTTYPRLFTDTPTELETLLMNSKPNISTRW